MYGFVHFVREALANNPDQLTHLIAGAKQALRDAAAREGRQVHDDTVTLQLLTHTPPPAGLRADLRAAEVEVIPPPEEGVVDSPTATLIAIGETSPR
jgi:hypothetical protein